MDNETKQIIFQALRERTKTLKRKIEAEFNPMIKEIYQNELTKITHIDLNKYEEKKKGA